MGPHEDRGDVDVPVPTSGSLWKGRDSRVILDRVHLFTMQSITTRLSKHKSNLTHSCCESMTD
jgi:hypothetical protein